MAPSKKTTTRTRRSSARGERNYVPRVRARARARHQPRCYSLDSLPNDVVKEVIARVAASSAIDLHNCKLSCKALHEIGDEKEVLQKVSLESFSFFTWYQTNEAKSFFKRCQDSNNPEALFQLGMLQYFSRLMLEEGIRNLERAAEQGHNGAAYVLGIILLCCGDDESSRKGTSLVMNSAKVLKGRGIVDCRKKVDRVMNSIWMNNHLILRCRPCFTCAMARQHEVWRGWGESNYFDEDIEGNVVCESCRCNREVKFFFDLLPAPRFVL